MELFKVCERVCCGIYVIALRVVLETDCVQISILCNETVEFSVEIACKLNRLA